MYCINTNDIQIMIVDNCTIPISCGMLDGLPGYQNILRFFFYLDLKYLIAGNQK
jgi:hypothetical protein